MAGNYFDKYDEQPAGATPQGGNYFDKYDEPVNLGGPKPKAEKGYLVSLNEKGELEPGELIKPVVEAAKSIARGGFSYTPRPLQPVSNEAQLPDIQPINDAAEIVRALAMAQPTPGILGSVERQAAIRAGRAAEDAFGPATQPAFGPQPTPIAPTPLPPASAPNEAALTAQYGPPAVQSAQPQPPAAAGWPGGQVPPWAQPSAGGGGPGAPPALTPRDALLAAGQRQGVDVPTFIASDSVIPKMLAGGASGTPIIGEPIVNATRGMAEQMGNRLEDLATGLVPHGGNNQSAGSAARQGIVDWIKNESAKQMSIGYDALDQMLKKDTRVDLTQTRAYQALMSMRDYESATRDGKRTIDLVRRALDTKLYPEGLTYEGIKGLRTSVGDRLSGDIVEPGTSQRLLKGLYAALSKDLRYAAGESGLGVKGFGKRRALAAFDEANTRAEEIFSKREELGRLVGREGDNRPADVYDRIVALASSGSRGDIAQLALAKTSMGPAAWDEVRAAAISRMGLDKNDVFSPARFTTDYGSKRISDQAKDVLFGSELRKHLDDIAELSRAFEASAKYGNPSGTGRSVAVTAALVGAWAHPLALLAEIGSGHFLAQALSKPATAAATANYVRAYTQAAANPSPATQAQTLQAAKTLLERAGEKASNATLLLLMPRKERGAEKPQAKAQAPKNAMASVAPVGATATNPSTGARLKFDGRGWQTIRTQ